MERNFVREMIENWLNERPSRSFAKLQGLTNVSETSLRRIRDGAQVPGFETIINIGKATENAEMAIEAIGQHFPHQKEFVRRGFLLNAAPIVEGQPRDLMEFLETPGSTRIFLLLFTRAELTRDFVENRFGQYGITVLDSLVEKGYAVSADGQSYRRAMDKFSYPNANAVLQVLRQLILSYDVEDLGTPAGRLVVMTDGLTEDAARRVNSVIQQCAVEVKEIMHDPASTGDLSVAVSLMMQSIK